MSFVRHLIEAMAPIKKFRYMSDLVWWDEFLFGVGTCSNLTHRCIGSLGLCSSDRKELVSAGMERRGLENGI